MLRGRGIQNTAVFSEIVLLVKLQKEARLMVLNRHKVQYILKFYRRETRYRIMLMLYRLFRNIMSIGQ